MTDRERSIRVYEGLVLEAKENVAICTRQGWNDLLKQAQKELEYFENALKRARNNG
jgi:hypothetical protein